MKKKAQGISINTIIIAAIALVVLIVLIAVFSGRMNIFGQDLDKNLRGELCRGDDRQVVSGVSCPEEQRAAYLNFRQCDPEDEGDYPERTGCMKGGYVCCIDGQQ